MGESSSLSSLTDASGVPPFLFPGITLSAPAAAATGNPRDPGCLRNLGFLTAPASRPRELARTSPVSDATLTPVQSAPRASHASDATRKTSGGFRRPSVGLRRRVGLTRLLGGPTRALFMIKT